jgi:hypothetical protein
MVITCEHLATIVVCAGVDPVGFGAGVTGAGVVGPQELQHDVEAIAQLFGSLAIITWHVQPFENTSPF